MSVAKKALVFVFAMVVSSTSSAQKILSKSEIGEKYSLVRQDLLENGSTPVDQIKNPDRYCLNDQQACDMYPELSSCAGDLESPCRFEWQAKDRRRFYIVTTGEDARTLIVVGINYD